MKLEGGDGLFFVPPDHHASFALIACDAHCGLGRIVQIE